jgi:hypothetical protein
MGRQLVVEELNGTVERSGIQTTSQRRRPRAPAHTYLEGDVLFVHEGCHDPQRLGRDLGFKADNAPNDVRSLRLVALAKVNG